MKKELNKRLIEGFGLLLVKRSDYVIINKKRYLKKDSERLVNVKSVATGEYKHYLKDSPLVVKVHDGNYELASECVFLKPERTYVNRLKHDVVNIEDEFYLSSSTIRVDGKYYYCRDNRVCKDYLTGNHILVSESITLSPSYGTTIRTHKNNMNQLVKLKDGSLARKRDTNILVDKDGNCEYVFTGPDRLMKGKHIKVFVEFNNPKLISLEANNVVYGVASDKDVEFFTLHQETDVYVHKSKVDEYVEMFNKWFDTTHKPSVIKAISVANSNFSDKDENENKPEFMRFDARYKPRNGHEIGFDGRFPLAVSLTARKLGGIRYTYGVEIETSNGFLSDEELKSVQLCSIGDNSIAGNEYITAPLHGDLGIDILEKQMELIGKRCVVDDSCSIHVHVGGANSPRVTSPTFNMHFAINAIRLGCQIEESLFMCQPPSRSPWKKHCHSITRRGDFSGDYRDICEDNYKTRLGDYVFGRPIDREINQMTVPQRWNNQRYKWLNLINTVANTGIKTVEFRIFSPTTTLWKALQSIRISLAFVWFVENRQSLITAGGVTLSSMLEEAYKEHPKVYNDVMDYVTSRTMKFSREVYKKIK